MGWHLSYFMLFNKNMFQHKLICVTRKEEEKEETDWGLMIEDQKKLLKASLFNQNACFSHSCAFAITISSAFAGYYLLLVLVDWCLY